MPTTRSTRRPAAHSMRPQSRQALARRELARATAMNPDADTYLPSDEFQHVARQVSHAPPHDAAPIVLHATRAKYANEPADQAHQFCALLCAHLGLPAARLTYDRVRPSSRQASWSAALRRDIEEQTQAQQARNQYSYHGVEVYVCHICQRVVHTEEHWLM